MVPMVPMVPMIMSHWFDLVCLHGGSTFTKEATLFGRPTCDQQNNEAKTDFLWKLCTKSWQYVPQRTSSTRLGYPWVLAINCQAQKHAIKVLKSKTKVVSRSLGKVGRYRSNSENTDIFLGFGGSIRNLCNLQLSYTSIIYTRLGYMHYCIYIYIIIYIIYYIYTESWTWSPMLTQLHASVLPPAQPWTCKHCRTKRALAHPTYSYWFIPIFPFRTQWGLQIFKMFHNMFQKMFHNMFHKMFHKMFHNVEVPGQVASQCCEDFSIECGSNGSNKLSWVRFKQVAASSWLPSTSGWAVPINPS